jgi:hypothetical protein
MSKHLRSLFTYTCLLTILGACAAPNSGDMYKAKEKEKVQLSYAKPSASAQSTAKTTSPSPRDEKRYAAARAYGLDETTGPEKLVGMSSRDIRQALGQPSFVRKDKGVEIWQYHSQTCILDLFLYESSTKKLTVDHSELRGSKRDSRVARNCFQTILFGQTS